MRVELFLFFSIGLTMIALGVGIYMYKKDKDIDTASGIITVFSFLLIFETIALFCII